MEDMAFRFIERFRNWLQQPANGHVHSRRILLVYAAGAAFIPYAGDNNPRAPSLEEKILDWIDNSLRIHSNAVSTMWKLGLKADPREPLDKEAKEQLDKALVGIKGAIAMTSDGRVLYDKDADDFCNPASMVKMMTLLITQGAIESGLISPNDEITLSREDVSVARIRSELPVGTKMTVHEAMRLVGSVSANDVALALAVHVAGSPENFVKIMNKVGEKLGLSRTCYVSPNGLISRENVDQRSTPRDTSNLVSYIRKISPGMLERYCSGEPVEINGRQIGKLPKFLDENFAWRKTGTGMEREYDDESGESTRGFGKVYNMATTCGNIVIVVMGAKSSNHRNQAVEKIAEAVGAMQGARPAVEEDDLEVEERGPLKVANAKTPGPK